MSFAGVAFATLSIATGGMGDAFKAAAEGDAQALAEALEGLSPAARRTVRAFAGVNDQFQKVRATIQQRLFGGLARQLQAVAGHWLPRLETQLGGVATALNGMAKQAAQAVQGKFFTGAVEQVTTGTARALTTLQGAVAPLLNSVAALAAAGTPMVNMLARSATEGARAAEAFLTSAEGAQWMATTMDRARQTMETLGSIASNLTSAIAGIFTAGQASGWSLLQTIDQLTARFAAWVNSVEGQRQLQQWFATLGQIAEHVAVILPKVLGAVSSLVSAFNALPGPFQAVIRSFLAWSIVLIPIASRVAGLVTTVRQLIPLFRGLGKGALVLARGFATAGALVALHGPRMTKTFVRVGAAYARLAVRSLLAAARIAASWLIAMGPVGWVIATVVALAALIIANWDRIKKWTIAAWNAVSGAVVAAWKAVRAAVATAVAAVRGAVSAAWNWVRSRTVAVWNAVRGATSRAWNAVTGLVRRAWSAIRRAVSAGVRRVVGFMRRMPGRIRRAVGNLAGLLYNAGRNVVIGLWNGIVALSGWLASKIWGWIRSVIPDPVERFLGIASPSKLMRRIGRRTGEGLAVGLDDMRRRVAEASRKLAQAAVVKVQDAAGDAGVDITRGRGDGGPSINVTVNNPLAERASDTIQRKLVGLSELGLFGDEAA